MQNYNEDPRKSTGNVTVSAKSSIFHSPQMYSFYLHICFPFLQENQAVA